MKNPSFKVLALALFAGLSAPVSQASIVGVRDLDGAISLILNGSTYNDTTQDLAVRVGTWNSGSSAFTVTGGSNTGYFSADLIEMKTSISANDNTVVGSAGTPFAIAFYNAISTTANSTLINSTPLAVLTDSSWVLPTFSLGVGETWFTLGSNTSAAVGSYSYNGGNQVVTLVPEPTTGSLLLLGGLGLVALRRLRKV